MPKRTEKLIVGDRRATSIGMSPAASIDISCLLHLALKRRRCKLAVQTVYTHQQIKDFVKAKIGPEWHIFVPTFSKTSINHSLSAAWPADESATAKAKLWLESSGCKDAADLLAGACEPMAVFSSNMAADVLSMRELEEEEKETRQQLVGDCDPCALVQQAAIKQLCSLVEPALDLFGPLVQAKWVKGPLLWDTSLPSDLGQFLFGTEEAGQNLKLAAARAENSRKAAKIPLYVLTYIFDGQHTRKYMQRGRRVSINIRTHIHNQVMN